MITCKFEDGGKANLRHVVVHAIVEKDGKILLEKRSSKLSTGAGQWCLPGGFLDRDENSLQAVLRELLEETGWMGEIISFFRINSNPNRIGEDRQNVAMEFIIKPLKQIQAPDNESSEVKWVAIDELTSLNFAFDHGETVKLYLQYRQKPFSLPLIS